MTAQPTADREKILAMNEALMLGSVRQHELIEASENLNAQLQQEIRERKLAEQTLRKSEDALRASREEIKHYASNLEIEVIARTAKLTATTKQLETFVYSIAHDLRAPLRAMQGFSTLLLDETGAVLGDERREYANRIKKAAQFMDAMLIDLLAFSCVSQENIALTPLELGPLVDSVLSRLQQVIQEKKAGIDSSGAWPVALAHETTLAQVLFNLVSNALKFVSPDVPPLVRLRTEDRAGFIRVWVEDNGPGIAPRHQREIFGLFTRLEGEKYKGTGIGLAIVQQGVERMGGQVGVESVPGQGSRFWFELRKG